MVPKNSINSFQLSPSSHQTHTNIHTHYSQPRAPHCLSNPWTGISFPIGPRVRMTHFCSLSVERQKAGHVQRRQSSLWIGCCLIGQWVCVDCHGWRGILLIRVIGEAVFWEWHWDWEWAGCLQGAVSGFTIQVRDWSCGLIIWNE